MKEEKTVRLDEYDSWTTHLHSSIIISRSQKVGRDVPDTVYWCTFPCSVLLRCVLISGHPLVHGQSGIDYLCGPGVDYTLSPQIKTETHYSRQWTDASHGYSPQRLPFPNGPDVVTLFVDGQPTTRSLGRFECEPLIVLTLLVIAKSLDLPCE